MTVHVQMSIVDSDGNATNYAFDCATAQEDRSTDFIDVHDAGARIRYAVRTLMFTFDEVTWTHWTAEGTPGIAPSQPA